MRWCIGKPRLAAIPLLTGGGDQLGGHIRYLFLMALAVTSACSESRSTETMPESGPEMGNASASRTVPRQASDAVIAHHRAKPSAGAANSLPETPFSEASAQGAANVVQTYAALVEAKKYRDAAALWEERSAGRPEEFARQFDRFREWHAEVGGPGPIEGAAGSLYVEVPLRLYGRLANGASFSRCAIATLRRVNAVPGATAEQNKWHIIRIADLDVTGSCLEARPTGERGRAHLVPSGGSSCQRPPSARRSFPLNHVHGTNIDARGHIQLDFSQRFIGFARQASRSFYSVAQPRDGLVRIGPQPPLFVRH